MFDGCQRFVTLPTSGEKIIPLHPVSCVLDSNGNNYHGIQRGALTTRPGYAPGQHDTEPNGVRFDGVGSYLYADGASTAQSGADKAATLVTVAKLHDTTGAQYLWSFGGSAAATQQWALRTDAATNWEVHRDDDAGAGPLTETGGTPDTSWHILTVLFTGTVVSLFVDGTAVITTQGHDVGAATLNQFTLGALRVNSVSGYASLSIAAQFNYSAALTAANYQGIETWLRTNIPGLSNAIASLGHSAAAVDPDSVSNQELSLHLWDPTHLGREIARSYDLSGGFNHGVQATQANRPVFLGGANAGALFDGAGDKDDIIDAGSASTLDNIFNGGGTALASITAYSEGEGTIGRIVGKAQWRLYVSDESGGATKLNFIHAFHNGGNVDGRWRTTATDITNDSQTFVAVTYTRDATTNDPTLYVDATAKDTGGSGLDEIDTPDQDPTSDAGSNAVVGNNTGGTTTFDGIIHYVAIFNATLTAAEIESIRTGATKPSDYASCVLYHDYSNPTTTTDSDGMSASLASTHHWVPKALVTYGTSQTAYGESATAQMYMGITAGVLDSGARQHNGTTQFFSVTSHADLQMGTGDFSISTWLYRDAAGAAHGLFADYDNTASETGWDFYIGASNAIGMRLDNGTADLSVASTSTLDAARWYHVVLTVDRDGNVKYYLDGVDLAEDDDVSSYSAVDLNSTDAKRVGRDRGGAEHNGRMARTAIWKGRLLSAADVTELYNNGKGLKYSELSAGLKTSLSAYWDGDETVAGAVLDDKHTGGHDGADNGTVTCALGPPSLSRSIAVASLSAVGTSDCYRHHQHYAVAVPASNASTIDHGCRFTTINNAFLTLNAHLTPAASASLVGIVALGGDGVEARVVDITSPTTPGVQTDDLGVDWDVGINISVYETVVPTADNDATIGLGIVDASLNMATVMFASNAAQGTTQTDRGQLTSHAFCNMGGNGSALDESGIALSKSGQNITVNWDAVSGTARVYSILALSGVSATVGTFTADGSSGLTEHLLQNAGSQPCWVFAPHFCNAASASVQSHAILSISSLFSPSSRATVSIIDKDGEGTTDTESNFENDEALQVFDDDGVNQGEGDLERFSSSSFSINTTAGFASEQIPFLAISPPVGTLFSSRRRLLGATHAP